MYIISKFNSQLRNKWNHFYRKGTDATPEISFDITQNYFLIKGKSVFFRC
jgi:hypothetical protein